MPTLNKPTSDHDRIILLDNIVLTGNQDNLAGDNLVDQATLDAITNFLPGFKTAEINVKAKAEIKITQVQEKGDSIRMVEINCRDTWEGVKRRKVRLNLPDVYLTYYELPLDGKVPKIDSDGDWLKTLRNIIEGDARAVAAGYPATSDPTAAEMQTVYDNGMDEFDDVARADREHDQAQAAIAELRPKADEFINEVYDQLMFNTRKMDKASQRRVARTYGYRYDYSPGEPPEEVPAAPDLAVEFVRPDMTVSCNEVETADAYQFVYSEDDINWTELYIGKNNSYTYQPPVGRRVYRVRAENEYGYGDWSEEVEYTVEEVPE